MTFLEIQVLTSDILDDPSNGYFTLPLLKTRINLAQVEIQKRLISANQEYYSRCVNSPTVANQQVYSLPADFIQIIRLDYILQGTSTQKILPMTPNQRDVFSAESGPPSFYYFQKNNLVLWPTPDAAYTLHLEYSQRVVDMVLDADTPDVPQHFQAYIPYITARDCMVKDGRSLSAIQKQLDDYETLMKQIAVQRHADGPRMVTMTNGWD